MSRTTGSKLLAILGALVLMGAVTKVDLLNQGQTVSTMRTSTVTNATTSFATTGLVLPTVQPSTTYSGHCSILWSSSSVTTGLPTFGAQLSATPTGLWVEAVTWSTATSVTNTTIASTTQTAVTASLTPSATSTVYLTTLNFVLQNSSTANTLTVYFKSSGAGTITVQPGSDCHYLP